MIYYDRKFEMFESWTDEAVAELTDFSVTEFHSFGKVIVADSRHNDFIYVCLKVCLSSDYFLEIITMLPDLHSLVCFGIQIYSIATATYCCFMCL